jgi:N-acetylneuraminic acid mutarotase
VQAYRYRLISVSLFWYLLVILSLSFPAGAQTTGTNEWAWMSGNNTGGSFGVYGTLGTPASSNAPGGRSQGATWADSKGNLWLFGGSGFDSVGNAGTLNDFWEFNPSSNEWTWMGGISTLPSALASPSGVYGTLGTPAAGNIPGGRSGAATWTDANGDLWLFGGAGTGASGSGGELNDLWEFHPSTNGWVWMGGGSSPNQPGVYGTLGTAAAGDIPGARANAVSWTDSKGNFWLMGGAGYDSAGNEGNLNDLWKFSPSTGQWAWMSGANTIGQASVPGTLRVPSAGNVPGARNTAVSWTDNNGNLWLFGGIGGFNDLWEFNPTTNQWAWMSGNSAASVNGHGQPSVYGTLQLTAPNSVPGSRTGAISWTDRKGNLWMFGGVGPDSTTTDGLLNDLWEFNPSTGEWTWMAGNSTALGGCAVLANWCGQFGVYGTFQTPALGNAPGGRYDGVSWTDSKGNLWLFGGGGYDANGLIGYLSDLWEFQPNTGSQSITATPIISPGSGNYASWQTVTISDATSGATISYVINGLTPALVYTGPIMVSSSETIEAIASASGLANSNIATANYVANLPQAVTPIFSLTPGTYSSAQVLTIYESTPGATVYYAFGALPTAGSNVYTGPITISSPEVVEAIAVADNYLNSNAATAAYNIAPNSSAEWTWMGGASTAPTSCPNTTICGQSGWYGTFQTPAAANFPGARWAAVSWTDNKGNLWLFGGVGSQVSLNDLWKFAPSTAEWAWMSGSNSQACNTSCGQTGSYGTLGIPASSNSPGSRLYPAAWTDNNGNLWLFGGQGFDANGDQGALNDLWKFDPSSNEWTWMGGSSTLPCYDAAADECWGQPGVFGTHGVPAPGNMPGARYQATSWIDSKGNFWIFGGYGWDSRGIECHLNDLWEFNPSANEWVWWSGNKFCPNVGESGWEGVYGTTADAFAVGNIPWSLQSPASWADNSGNLWLFGGIGWDTSGDGYYLNDMWEFNPSIDEWAWTSANSGPATYAGEYGTMGDWEPANIPGDRYLAANWTDKNGNFWLLGGEGTTPYNFVPGTLNDLWEFKPSLNEWSWMGGSNSPGQAGVYGVLGTPATGNVPGARYAATTWTDSSGNLWLFGGSGDDAQGHFGYLNDLWEFGLTGSPTVHPPSPAATPVLSLPAGPYGSPQTLTITDQTPGATIYYTTNGTTPNAGSTVYAGQIAVSSSETVESLAVSSGYSISAVATAAYTINLPQAASPMFSLPVGTYTPPQTVTISDATAGATIYYTTDGTTPTTSSSVYSGPLTVSSTETLQALAVAPGLGNSAIASATYTINLQPGFTVTATAVTVNPGATIANGSSVTVTPVGGFTGNVVLTAAVTSSPAGAAYIPTLSFAAPGPVSIVGSNAGTATLIINTTAPTSGVLTLPKRPGFNWYEFGDASLALFLMFGIPARRRSWRTMLGMLVLLFTFAGGMAACGGGGGSGGGGGGTIAGTTAGSYTVTITATSGSTTATGTVALTVQ